jgi:hypothetical protein
MSLPPPLLWGMGVAAICAGVAMWVRSVDLVRRPDAASFHGWGRAVFFRQGPAKTQRAYVREQRFRSIGLVVLGVVFIGAAFGHA